MATSNAFRIFTKLNKLCFSVHKFELVRSSSFRFNSTSSSTTSSSKTLTIHWKKKSGELIKTTSGDVGDNLMRLAHKHGIELEGACEGVCACSTCHVILEDSIYRSLPEPSENEEDMLDQAPGLTPTSRLGCQVVLEPKHDGITVVLPGMTRNFYVDGHVPKPH